MRIHAIQTGLVRIKMSQIEGRGHGPARRLAPLVDRAWSPWLPTFAWAIEHPEGVILVDTGATARLKSLPRWHPYFRLAVQFDIEPEQEARPQLQALGIGPKDVRLVVPTHLHIDHDAGLGAFPDSTVLASAGEVRQASGLAGRIRGYLPQRWPASFDPKPLEFRAEPYGAFARSRRLTARAMSSRFRRLGIRPITCRSLSRRRRCSLSRRRRIVFGTDHARGHIDGVECRRRAAATTLDTIRRFAAAQPTIYLQRTTRPPCDG